MIPRRPTVALIIRRFAGRGGGAERIYCELADLLVARGYDVTCLHCEWSRAAPAFPLDPRVVRVNLWRRGLFWPGLPAWLRVASLGYRNGKFWAPVAWLSKHGAFAWALAQFLRRHQPDVAISLMPNANTPTLLASLLSGTPVIASNHNAPQQDYQSHDKWDQNPIDISLRVNALKIATRIHVLQEDYASFFPDKLREKIEVIHNYPSDEVTSTSSNVAREHLIVGVGRLTPVKNFCLLVDAWRLIAAEFPTWRIEIYGQGEEQELLQKRIREHGLQESVTLMGHSETIATAYQRASVLAHPALYEGFPLAVTEALASGVPVLAFAGTSGVDQLVVEQVNGILAPRDEGVAGFAARLGMLLRDPSLLQALSARSKASVERFSKAAYIERWIEVIEAVRSAR